MLIFVNIHKKDEKSLVSHDAFHLNFVIFHI